MARQSDKSEQSLDSYQTNTPVSKSILSRYRLSSQSLKLVYGIRYGLRKYFLERIPHLANAINLLLIWFVLVGLIFGGILMQFQALTSYYTQAAAAAGGTYTEGLVGQVTNFNPIYVTTPVDQAVASLVFANLYRYDQNGQLQPVLAESVSVDDRAQQYTLTLKQGLKWHDGQPLTIEDVIFTIETIQNPVAQSPLRENWRGVSLDQIDQYTVILTLPASFSPFAHNFTLGILPKHLLDGNLEQLRSDPFNYQPIGSGPFIFNKMVPLSETSLEGRELRIELIKNPDWPSELQSTETDFYLDQLHFWVVANNLRLTELFNEGLISGGFGLIESEIRLQDDEYQVARLNSMNAVYLFFKNSSPFCNSPIMRRALTHALDVPEILASLPNSSQRIFGPLLPEHNGYQRIIPPDYNLAEAQRLLEQAGWQAGDGGWYKDQQRLSLVLTTQKDTDYEILAQNISQQLAKINIPVSLDLRSSENISLEILQNHNYGDLLLYGLNLGGDSDVYSYWHSSQIDSRSILRLNLAEYRSNLADEALEAGRSRADSEIRRKRYADFQTVWHADLPALPLYRFQLDYYTLKGVRGPGADLLMIEQTDRFLDVTNWSVLQTRQTKLED